MSGYLKRKLKLVLVLALLGAAVFGARHYLGEHYWRKGFNAPDTRLKLKYLDRSVFFGSVTGLMLRGSQELDAADYSRAAADFSRAVRGAPEYPVGYLLRGEAYSGLGQCYKALSDYDKALELMPVYVESALVKNNSFNKIAGDYGLAKDEVSRGLYLRLYIGRAKALVCADRFADALLSAQKAVLLNPAHAPAYCARADVYLAIKDFKKARADYAKAMALDPGFAQAKEGFTKTSAK